jgi:hypothetical protein
MALAAGTGFVEDNVAAPDTVEVSLEVSPPIPRYLGTFTCIQYGSPRYFSGAVYSAAYLTAPGTSRVWQPQSPPRFSVCSALHTATTLNRLTRFFRLLRIRFVAVYLVLCVSDALGRIGSAMINIGCPGSSLDEQKPAPLGGPDFRRACPDGSALSVALGLCGAWPLAVARALWPRTCAAPQVRLPHGPVPGHLRVGSGPPCRHFCLRSGGGLGGQRLGRQQLRRPAGSRLRDGLPGRLRRGEACVVKHTYPKYQAVENAHSKPVLEQLASPTR